MGDQEAEAAIVCRRKVFYIVVTRLLICDRELLHRDMELGSVTLKRIGFLLFSN